MEIRKIKELTNKPEGDYVWSPYAADYNTIYHNKELGTNSFLFIGAWVKQ